MSFCCILTIKPIVILIGRLFVTLDKSNSAADEMEVARIGL